METQGRLFPFDEGKTVFPYIAPAYVRLASGVFFVREEFRVICPVDLKGAVGSDFPSDEGETVEAVGQKKDGHAVFCIHNVADHR